MRKVLVSLAVVVVLGVGGYFGVDYWAQRVVAREVDGMLDGWRASVGSATRGRIELDIWKRTVKITDVAVQARSAPYPKIAVGQIVASGIEMSGKAARVELTDLEVSDVAPGPAGLVVRQTAPKVTLTEASAHRFVPRKAVTALEQMRLWLEQLSAVTATTIEIPSLVVSTMPPTAPAGGRRFLPPGATEYTYSNVALRDVKAGRVGLAIVDGIGLRAGIPGPARELKGEIGQLSIVDADLAPVLAFLEPSRPGVRPAVQGFQRVYREIAIGPYVLQFGDGTSVSIDKIVAQDVGLRPDKLSLDDIQFLTEIASGPARNAPPGHTPMLLDKVAGLYEGVQIGKLELTGLAFKSLRDGAKIASLRVDRLENGRLGGLAFEGFEGKPAYGDPVSFERIAVQGFDVAGFMRLMGELSVPTQPPPGIERLRHAFGLVQAIELKSIVVPDPKTRRTVRLEAFDLALGQLVGSVPSDVRVSLKLSGPITAPDPEPVINMLVASGMSTLAVGADVGARWNEAARTVTFEPASLEVGGLVAVTVKGSLANVSREVFSDDMAKAAAGAAQVAAGTLEVTLRDLGLVDVGAAEIARMAGRPPEEGRALLAEGWARKMQTQAEASPEARAFLEAMTKFVQGKGETVSLRLTPKSPITVQQLVEAVRVDPPGALLGAFNIEAQVGTQVGTQIGAQTAK